MEYEITEHRMGGLFSNADQALAQANRDAGHRGADGWRLVNGSVSTDSGGFWTIWMFWQRESPASGR
jgi:hypothetical protein